MARIDASLRWPGVPFALGSAVLFGATPVLSKPLLEIVDPAMLAALLYLGAGLGIATVRLAGSGGGLGEQAPLRRHDWPWLAAAIFAGGVVGPILLMWGVSLTLASSAALLLNLESVATMTIAWIVFREHVDRMLLLGALSILLGATILSWQGEGLSVDLGALCVAGACLAWGIDNNLTRKIANADPLQITMLKGLIAGFVNLAIALWTGASIPVAGVAIAAGVLGLAGIGASLVLFILALRHLGAARTGAYYSLAPFIGAVLAIAFLGEAVTAQLVLAALFMGAGLWIHLRETHEHQHDHEWMAHEHSHVHDVHHQHHHDGPVTEPHSHPHVHEPMRHSHRHYPDLHHTHRH
jgi:drug/metabolite transporter (DMT)-like permease